MDSSTHQTGNLLSENIFIDGSLRDMTDFIAKKHLAVGDNTVYYLAYYLFIYGMVFGNLLCVLSVPFYIPVAIFVPIFGAYLAYSTYSISIYSLIQYLPFLTYLFVFWITMPVQFL